MLCLVVLETFGLHITKYLPVNWDQRHGIAPLCVNVVILCVLISMLERSVLEIDFVNKRARFKYIVLFFASVYEFELDDFVELRFESFSRKVLSVSHRPMMFSRLLLIKRDGSLPFTIWYYSQTKEKAASDRELIKQFQTVLLTHLAV